MIVFIFQEFINFQDDLTTDQLEYSQTCKVMVLMTVKILAMPNPDMNAFANSVSTGLVALIYRGSAVRIKAELPVFQSGNC